MNDIDIRYIPRWLASIVQSLELEQKKLVSVDDIQNLRSASRAAARHAIATLVRLGWLRPIGARGMYEFIPGAAAGPYPSGDPWLVLRAELERRPGKFHVGANSAAWLLGYAQRTPRRHIVVAAPDFRAPARLRSVYEVLSTEPAPASNEVSGLPVPTPAELFVEVAQLAPRLKLDSAQGWLRRALADTTPEEIRRVLRDRGSSTWARAGYLAEVCGASDHAKAIAAIGRSAGGPFYTGHRGTDGPFSSRWRVYDTGAVA